MSSAIRVYGFGKRFRRATALESLDFEAPAGAIYGLAGPAGAGKTTFLKLLLNILPPSTGRSEVLGIDSRRLAPRDFEQIGYLSASGDMPSMTAGFYFQFLRGFYPAWDGAMESELIRTFQLLLDHKLGALSPSGRAKAALVATLAYRPRAILLDEPLLGVDPLSRGEILHALRTHAAGATILIAAEDPAEVESIATHIGYLEAGRLLCSAELSTLRARFREIVLTFDAAPPLTGDWPAAWLPPGAGRRLSASSTPASIPQPRPPRRAGAFPACKPVPPTPFRL